MRKILLALPLFIPMPLALAAEPLDCVIEPRIVAELTSSERGVIDDIMVSRGDWVTAGQPLIQLEAEVQRLQVEMAAARMESDLDLRSGETRLSLREGELDRALTLQERNVAAETQVEDARIEVALTQIALEEARLAREIARIEHAQAVSLLERRTIRSPVNGIVVTVEAARGEYAYEQYRVMTVAEMDPLHVEVFAPLDDYGRIAVRDEVLVTQAPPLDGRFRATVSVVDQVFDAASGTFGVRLEIANPDGSIPAGTRCKVDLDTSQG